MPPPMLTNGMSTTEIPARTSISSDHQSVLISSGVRSPGRAPCAWSGTTARPGRLIVSSRMVGLSPRPYWAHSRTRPPERPLLALRPQLRHGSDDVGEGHLGPLAGTPVLHLDHPGREPPPRHHDGRDADQLGVGELDPGRGL